MKNISIVRQFVVDSKDVLVRYPMRKDLDDMIEVLRDWYRERATNGEKRMRIDIKTTKNYWRKRMTDIVKKQAVVLVIEMDGRVRGYIHIYKGTGGYSHTAEIGIVNIVQKYRCRGFGKELLEAGISEAVKRLGIKLITLETNGNNHAVKLYRKCGFQRVGTIKKARFFCGEYVDRLRMVKYLY